MTKQADQQTKDTLQKFLDEAFAPYGDFPARNDVIGELHANLIEKYSDLVSHGKSDNEAYRLTVDSFGDVSEIMEQVPHMQPGIAPKGAGSSEGGDKTKTGPSVYKTIVDGIKTVTGNKPTAMASDLAKADLTDSDLAGKDFSMCALMETVFDRSDLHDTKFRAAALTDASFVDANLQRAVFSSADLTNANLTKADLTDAVFITSALYGATFDDTKLTNTEFNKSDLSGVSFDGLVLDGTIFNKSSLNKATFKGTVLRNVTFHHTAVKHAIFDGAIMDKLTYALLKGAKATLTDVVVQ